MRCVICSSPDIEEREVEEEIRIGNDIVVVPVKTKVCAGCGERYYDRKTMTLLEEIEDKLEKKSINLRVVGKVLKCQI